MPPIRCWTIRVHCKSKRPFHKAGIRHYYFHHQLGKKPTLWGQFGFYLNPKEATKPMVWLKAIGFEKVELEEC